MKKKMLSLLQKVLGFENYLFYLTRFKISFFKLDKYETELWEFIKLIPDGAILDIGANTGITMVPLAKKFTGANIHAFEPMPANIAALKRAIKYYKLKNVQLHEIALGEQQGELKMVMPVINNVLMQGLSHAYVEGMDSEWNKGKIFTIPMLKLDDVKALQGEQKIGAIKIDVENFEYYVLKGGEQLLRKHQPIIYSEIWDNEMRQPVLDFLLGLGYNIKIYEDGKLKDYTGQKVLNYIFVHKDSISK